MTSEEIDHLCQLQAEITQLELEIQKSLNHTTNIANSFNTTITNFSDNSQQHQSYVQVPSKPN